MFHALKNAAAIQFAAMLKKGELFTVNVDRDKVYETYLNGFDAAEKQEHNCNCCRSFLRQYGGIVSVDANSKRTSLWHLTLPAEVEALYAEPVRLLREYVDSLPISDIFISRGSNVIGTPSSYDTKRNTTWEHFTLTIPAGKYSSIGDADTVDALLGKTRTNEQMLERALRELKIDALDTVIELVGQDSIYRGKEHLPNLKKLREVKKSYDNLIVGNVENFLWYQSRLLSESVIRIKNTSMGELIYGLSEGKSLDDAVKAYEKMVAPANYKRPTALATPAMIQKAKDKLIELGYYDSLTRKQLSEADMTINRALFVYRPELDIGDAFAAISSETVTHPRVFDKVEEVNIDTFINAVLPTAKKIRVLLENRHEPNLVSLVGPGLEGTPSLFKWDNGCSWSYAGGTADSIKARVKAAGGDVSGVLRISLSWSNYDDLDLHLYSPTGEHVFYGNKRAHCGATLDVDMNAGSGQSRTPVENIVFKTLPKIEGKYTVSVNNFCFREKSDTGYEVEIEYDGNTYNFTHANNGPTGRSSPIVEFTFNKQDGVKFSGNSGKASAYPTKSIWGLGTGKFHDVTAVAHSPNFWGTNAVGLKHFLFMLDKCVATEDPRPFYNEFLKPELDAERKVFEMLGNKVKVARVDKELSGLGFSETKRDSILVEVTSTFKRVIKVTF